MKIIFNAILLFVLWHGESVIAQANNSEAGMTTEDIIIVSTPGTYEMTLPGEGRRYTLVIPDGYTGKDPVPLVMSLHYGGEVTPFYGRRLLDELIEPALRDLGAIMVGPDCTSGRWDNADASDDVLELMDFIEEHYNVNTERTLITGVSMGGMGTWYLAPRHSDRFKLAIPISGRPQADSTSMNWRNPMYIIHSKADEVVPIAPTQVAVEELKAKGAPVTFVVVDDLTHFDWPKLVPNLKAAVPWIQDNWN